MDNGISGKDEEMLFSSSSHSNPLVKEVVALRKPGVLKITLFDVSHYTDDEKLLHTRHP